MPDSFGVDLTDCGTTGKFSLLQNDIEARALFRAGRRSQSEFAESFKTAVTSSANIAEDFVVILSQDTHQESARALFEYR
jgi:hypothetical protein